MEAGTSTSYNRICFSLQRTLQENVENFPGFLECSGMALVINSLIAHLLFPKYILYLCCLQP